MPKKKTGQRKKAEKQKERQREIRNAQHDRDLIKRPCNVEMVSRLGKASANVGLLSIVVRVTIHWNFSYS